MKIIKKNSLKRDLYVPLIGYICTVLCTVFNPKTLNLFSMKKALLFVSMLLASSGLLNAQLVVSDGYAVDAMVSDFFNGSCVTVSNVTFTAPVDSAGVTTLPNIGFFDGSDCNVGLNAGLLLSSGSIQNAIGPNDSPSAGVALGLMGDPYLDNLLYGGPTFTYSYDAAVLEMDIVSTEPVVTFQYVFGSEEYMEWVGSGYNDVFGFFISGPDIVGETASIAFIPGTPWPVTINNLNNANYAEYYVNNEFWPEGTQRKFNTTASPYP